MHRPSFLVVAKEIIQGNPDGVSGGVLLHDDVEDVKTNGSVDPGQHNKVMLHPLDVLR